MQEKAKSNSVVTSTFDIATGLLTVSVVGVAEKIPFDVRAFAGAEAYDALTDGGKRGLGHGMTQRVSDRAAIGRDRTTGASATPHEKWSAMNALAVHYANGGGWELAGGGLPPVNRPALYQAVAAVRGLDAVKVEQTYRDKADEVLRSLLTIPAIAGKYTELVKAGAKAENPKAAELLAELEKATA